MGNFRMEVRNKMKKGTFFVFLTTILLCLLFSCKQEIKYVMPKMADVYFTINTEPYETGNVGSWWIEYRAIPLFGTAETPGRRDNWTKVVDLNNGKFMLDNLELGEWTFFIKVVNEERTLLEAATGTKNLQKDLLVVIDDPSELTGYGQVGIYVRADFIEEEQKIEVEYLNTKTDAIYILDNVEWTIMQTRKSFIDYSTYSQLIPAGNYLFTIRVRDHLKNVVMSAQEPVQIRATGTDPLILKLHPEGYPGGDLEVDDKTKYLEGAITAKDKAELNEEVKFTYTPMNTYTEENAVWYAWFADGKTYSTRDGFFYATFSNYGKYYISCSAIGINGEVQKNGSAKWAVDILPP